MTENRIDIIIREIEYWKEHKLLAETQCDFLLALYTQGEYKDTNTSNRKQQDKKQWNGILALHITFLISLVPLSFLVTYFTDISSYMQLGMILLFLVYSTFIFFYFKKRELLLEQISFVTSLFLILLLSIQIGQLFLGQGVTLNGIIISNMILWLVLSYKAKLKILFIISILAILFWCVYNYLLIL